MPTSLLKVSSLCCEKNDRVLFHDLNFSLNAHHAIQITGANGSGKTTLLRIIAGLGRMDSGSLHWQENTDKIYIGHKNNIKAQLTVRENLEFTRISIKNFKSQEIKPALDAFDLASLENIYAQHLSEGQLRRLALSRVLLSDATVWILDEPFTNLDHAGIQVCEAIMSRHVSQGGGIILSSHQPLTLNHHIIDEIKL